ncbi:MAG TPA: c-type cytochrome [Kofleriaceae bacterium]|nr:c-type cytochrome [Kofleriaceae bacterium]
MKTWVTIVFASTLVTACGEGQNDMAAKLTGGDPERGRLAMRYHGCGSCHQIDGVSTYEALVGPPLGGIAARAYLAGTLPNTPDNMMRWIRDPQGVVPGNVMPQMNITENEARHMAAYLYTLR